MQNLAMENILNIQQIIRGQAFQLLYSGKPWRKKVILEAL